MTGNSFLPTLVLGLGNPIRGDDGVGWRVVEVVQAKLAQTERVEVDTLAGGGLNLMERLVGYDRAIVVDAMQSGLEPGSVQVFPLEALDNPSAGHLGSTHETNLFSALEIGRGLGAHLPPPGGVMIVSIEAQPVFEFSEQLSPLVAQAVPKAAQKVMDLLEMC